MCIFHSLLALLLVVLSTKASVTNVRMAVVDLRPFPGMNTSMLDVSPQQPCSKIRGFLTFENPDADLDTNDDKVLVSLTLQNAANCKNADSNSVSNLDIKLYSSGFSYRGGADADPSMVVAPVGDVVDLFATEAHPYAGLARATVNYTDFSITVGNMKAGSKRSILGRSVVLTIAGVKVAGGIIGRRRPLDTSVQKNLAGGSPRQSGQALICKLDNRQITSASKTLAEPTSASEGSSIVVSAASSSGDVFVAARFYNTIHYTSGTFRRLSLHEFALARETNDAGVLSGNATQEASKLLGSVLSVGSSPPGRGLTLPCSRGHRREGDLGNFAGEKYLAGLDMLTGHADDWNMLVGSSCAVWKNPAKTCDAWLYGCTNNGESLEAVGVLALSDNSLSREHVLGQELAEHSNSEGDADYFCLGDEVAEASATLYSSSTGRVAGTVKLRQTSNGKGVSLSVNVPVSEDTHRWIGGTTNSDGKKNAMSIQAGGFNDKTLSFGGTFQPRAGVTSRAPPPALRRRIGDVGNLVRSVTNNGASYQFEYFYDRRFGESSISLNDPESSVIGRVFAIHANSDMFISPNDDVRGDVVAYGVLGINSPESAGRASDRIVSNVAKGPDEEHAPGLLACKMRGKVDGIVTLEVRSGAVGNQSIDFVSAAGTFSGFTSGKDFKYEGYVLQIHTYGDAEGKNVGAPVGSAPSRKFDTSSSNLACHDLAQFGYLGSIASLSETTFLLTYLRLPPHGSLAEYTGRSCVLSETDTGKVMSTGVLALPSHDNANPTLSLDKGDAWPQVTEAVDCRMAPEFGNKIRTSDGNDGTIQGASKPNNLGLIVGLSTSVPLVVIAAIGGIYWHRQHMATQRLKERVKILRKSVSALFNLSTLTLCF